MQWSFGPYIPQPPIHPRQLAIRIYYASPRLHFFLYTWLLAWTKSFPLGLMDSSKTKTLLQALSLLLYAPTEFYNNLMFIFHFPFLIEWAIHYLWISKQFYPWHITVIQEMMNKEMKMSKWIYSYLGSNFVFSDKVEMEIKRWEKMGRDILTLHSSLLLDANIFRKFQWHSRLAWEIYMKSKFILYTGHKIKGQKAMNGNSKIWTGGTAPEILRENKLIITLGIPHYFLG